MSRQAINRGSYVNDPSAESVYDAFGKVNDMTTDIYRSTGHSVMDYGAVGNSETGSAGTDDTTAIQNAINAAAATGGTGLVVVPGGHSYKITSTITIPWSGIRIIGTGTRGSQVNNRDTPPAFIWGGSAGGTMFQLGTNASNCMNVYFENVMFIGKFAATSEANAAATAVYYANTYPVDSGTGFRDCWFNGFNGDCLKFSAAGATNFFLTGGRFDAIFGGYAIYVDLKTNGHFTGIIDGNTNYVGGGSVNGKGFIFLDGESVTSGTGMSHLIISGLHTEINQHLVETFASGTKPYDKRGIIRLGVTTTLAQTQHTLIVNGWTNSSSGVYSYSSIHITAASGTDEDAALGAFAIINGGATLSASESGSGDDGTTNEVRMFGGKVPARKRFINSSGTYPAGNYRHGQIIWGEGKDNNGEHVGSFLYQRHGAFVARGITLKPETYAELTNSTPYMAGAVAYVTDATQTSGTLSTGGSTHKVFVVYNGSNWKIAALLDD